MPQVQVVQPGYSFGGELGQALGGGISQGLSNELTSYYQGKQRQQQMEGLAPIFEQLGLPKQGVEQLIKSGLAPEQAIAAAAIYQKQRASQAAEQARMQPEIEEKEKANEVINDMADLVEKGNLGKATAWNQLFEYGRQDRALYDTLAVNLEKELVKRVGKGTLSQKRFAYIQKLLPSSSNTDATNRGKLKAIAKELGLSINNSEFLRAIGDRGKESAEEPSSFGAGKIVLTDPQSGKSFYPTSEEDVREAKKAGWKVSGGK